MLHYRPIFVNFFVVINYQDFSGTADNKIKHNKENLSTNGDLRTTTDNQIELRQTPKTEGTNLTVNNHPHI